MNQYPIDGFIATTGENEIVVDSFITIHYFVYPKNFFFPGERHNFWEFLYVDKGQVKVSTDDKHYDLTQGQIIFHAPNEFHTVSCNTDNAPNLIVIAFTCNSPAMETLRHIVLNVNEKNRRLLSVIIQEAESSFDSKLEDPYIKGLKPKEEIPFGAFQIMKTNLELILLDICRDLKISQQKPHNDVQVSSLKDRAEYLRMAGIINYLEENVYKKITLEEVCKKAYMSRSSLQKMFKSRTGESVMNYFIRLKMTEAKRLLTDGRYNISGISDILGFNSIHYFSRQFKAVTGMSPSEYTKSINSQKWNKI